MAPRAMLRFAEQEFPSRAPIRSWEGFWEFLESLPQRGGRLVPRPTGHNPTVSAFARVDDGRWIADCPWGCGSAFNLPVGADWFWCTECVGGGLGLTAALVWPDSMDRLSTNLESLPTALQDWPCLRCRQSQGSPACENCRAMQGLEG